MSRSGYSDDCDGWALIRWRGAVASAIRGRKGQALLAELATALDALPTKELVAHTFHGEAGAVCTLGAICTTRGVEMPAESLTNPDYWDDYENPPEFANRALGIPSSLAAEIMWLNDEGEWHETPAGRWRRMRAWVAENTTDKSTLKDSP